MFYNSSQETQYDIMRSMMSVHRYRLFFETLGLFCLSLLIFLWGQAALEVIGFESRFYLFAMEMWRDGFNWFPQTYQHFYPDYPVTATLLIYFFANIFGVLNKFVAVFPSALAAALTLVVTYLIGALHSKRWGLAAAFLLLLTVAFIKSARSVALDIYPTLITTCCFYCLYSADIKKKPRRAWWIYPLMILGFAFRGPIGLVMPSGVVCIYYLFAQNYKRFFVSGLFALILLLSCSALLLAIAYHVGGVAFMQSVLRMQVLGRMDDSHIPLHFYFTKSIASYALSFPLAILIFFGMRKQIVTAEKKLLWKLVGWILIILIGMSIPGDKKIRYVLPMIPAVALIAAYPYARLFKEKYFDYLLKILTQIFLYFPTFFILLTEIIFYYAKNRAFGIHYRSIIISLGVLQLFNLWLFYRTPKQTLRELFILFIAAMSFTFTYVAAFEPVMLYMDKTRDFVKAIEKLRLNSHAHLVFYQEKPDGLPIKYIINTTQDAKPLFIETEQELRRFKERGIFVSNEKHFTNLPIEVKSNFKMIAHNKIGHVNVVIFSNEGTINE